MNKLKSDYKGDTLSEKVENYLLSIGVTETEIYNVKAIMFGEPTRDLPAPPETVTLDSDNLTYTYDAEFSQNLRKGSNCRLTITRSLMRA